MKSIVSRGWDILEVVKPSKRRTSIRGKWKTVGAALAGTLATLWAARTLRKLGARRPRATLYAQSGQAPSRTHIRLSSHPSFQEH